MPKQNEITFETSVHHHEWDEVELEMRQKNGCAPEITLRLDDADGSSITLQGDELETILECFNVFISAAQEMGMKDD